MMVSSEGKRAKLVSVIIPILNRFFDTLLSLEARQILAGQIADAIIAQHSKCRKTEKVSG